METVTSPGEYNLNENQWWFLYDSVTSNVVIKPRQASGKISSPHTLVVADTKEECDQYIADNNLSL